MRKITLITLTLFTALSYAQIGINTNTPDASSALEIESTTGGILIPRMTEAQRDAIVSPATGLMVYQTDETPGFYFYNGTAWAKIEGADGADGEQGNLLFASHNVSFSGELNQNGIQVINEQGTAIWGSGSSFTVPSGKIWKIIGYSGNVSSGLYSNGERWINEGRSITFQGNSSNGSSLPFKFTAIVYDKSFLDFDVVYNEGTAIWGSGSSFTVPAGKIWKIIGYSGNVSSGLYSNGEWWIDEGQSITFQGNSGNGSSLPFKFIAFEYTK